MKIIIITSAILFFILFNKGIAQFCPVGGGPWTNSNQAYSDVYGNTASIDYKHRSIGASGYYEYEAYIDWYSLSTDSDFLSDSTLFKLLRIKITESMFSSMPAGQHGFINIYYEKLCYAKIRARIRVDQSLEVCCAEGMSSSEYIYQHYDGQQNVNLVDVFQDKYCGFSCCYMRIWVYKDGVGKINLSGPSYHSLTSCDPESSYDDCITKQPVPCVSGDCAE